MKSDEYIEPIVLTPKNIPDYAREGGLDESELMNQYYEALAQNQILYGFKGFCPEFWKEMAREESRPGSDATLPRADESHSS